MSEYSPQDAQDSRGVKHVVYWKHTNEAGAQPLKVNITVYDNDILQVIFFDHRIIKLETSCLFR